MNTAIKRNVKRPEKENGSGKKCKVRPYTGKIRKQLKRIG
jgi:hypothetical protein